MSHNWDLHAIAFTKESEFLNLENSRNSCNNCVLLWNDRQLFLIRVRQLCNSTWRWLPVVCEQHFWQFLWTNKWWFPTIGSHMSKSAKFQHYVVHVHVTCLWIDTCFWNLKIIQGTSGLSLTFVSVFLKFPSVILHVHNTKLRKLVNNFVLQCKHVTYLGILCLVY